MSSLTTGSKLALGVLNGVALFGDGKAHHLQTWVYGKYPDGNAPCSFCQGRIRLQSLSHTGDAKTSDFTEPSAMQRDVKGEVVIGLGEYPVDDFKVEGIRRDDVRSDSGSLRSAGYSCRARDEAAEDVPRPEVNPQLGWASVHLLTHDAYIVFRKGDFVPAGSG